MISCLTSSLDSLDACYIDSGATCHMSSVGNYFTTLREDGFVREVVLGDDTIIIAIGRGAIYFVRESQFPMTVRDVLYASLLKINLIYVSSIEDGDLRCCLDVDMYSSTC